MTGPAHWRSLQSVMMVTLHVAVVAYVIRVFARPATWIGSIFLGVPVAIALAVFLTWPISRAIASAFDPGDASTERLCPRCGRQELRPLIRTSKGIFQPVTGYRCAGCWSRFRQVGEELVEQPSLTNRESVDSTGIDFLDREASEAEVRFLDE